MLKLRIPTGGFFVQHTVPLKNRKPSLLFCCYYAALLATQEICLWGSSKNRHSALGLIRCFPIYASLRAVSSSALTQRKLSFRHTAFPKVSKNSFIMSGVIFMGAWFTLWWIFASWTGHVWFFFFFLWHWLWFEMRQMFTFVFELNFNTAPFIRERQSLSVFIQEFSAVLTYLSRSLQAPPLPLPWCDVSDLNHGTFWRSGRC